MPEYKRRTFISSVGILASTALLSTVSAGSQSLLQGRIVDHTGSPIPHRQLTLSIRGGGHEEVVSDGNGEFEAELPSNETCDVGFYKYKVGPRKAEPNGVPHVYVVGEYSTGTGETDIGDLRIEKGHLVQAQALDSDGNPVGNASADLTVKGTTGHYLGTGGNLRTNHNGYVVVDDGEYSGMELNGTVELSLSIPTGDGGDIQYSREFFVDEPLNVTAKIGEGMTISTVDDSSGTDTSQSTSEPTDTSATTSQTSTSETERTTDKSTSTPTSFPDQADENPETTTRSSHDENSSRTTTDGRGDTQSRGFFSNDASGDEFEMLSDPFVLTVGGFVLSAGGMAHQLIRGR